MNINPSTTALLVIDMQNDFVEEGALFEIPSIHERLPVFRAFIDACRGSGVAVIYTRHTYDPADNQIEARLFPNLKEGGLRAHTHGWDIHSAVAPEPGDTVIDKTRYDAFYKTDLEHLLETRGITDIIIAGTMTEICCESTARSAMYRNYRVESASDLNFTRDPRRHAHSLDTLASHFGWVRTSEEILHALYTPSL